MREVVAEFRNPVMLYSIGKDSSVMLHIAQKAFYPSKPPFPLLHVDTTWKFKEMIAFRDQTAARLGMDLLIHINEEGLARGISPVASGSVLHTQVMKTEALRQALDKWQFDAAFGGARRDEEKSSRQRAHLLTSVDCACLGSTQPASGALEFIQYQAAARRIDARVSLVELDRNGCLGVHPCREYSGRDALFRS